MAQFLLCLSLLLMCLTLTGVVSSCSGRVRVDFLGVCGIRRSGSGVVDRDLCCRCGSGLLERDLVGSCNKKCCA